MNGKCLAGGLVARAVPDKADVAAWAPSIAVAGAGGEPGVAGSAWCARRGGSWVSACWMLAMGLLAGVGPGTATVLVLRR